MPRQLTIFTSICALTVSSFAVAQDHHPVTVQAAPTASKADCFWPNEWQGWKAAPDSKSIYLHVGRNRIYKLELAGECPELQYPDAHLVTHLRGTDLYCGPLDFDLKVAQPHGVVTACIVSNMTQLSPAEAAALPKDLRP